MAGYTKNIAVIRGIKSGFSADGGQLSGLIKIENYRLFMRVEISRINFAPLTCGRYVSAVSDGKCVTVFEGDFFEGESKTDTSAGFVGVICFVNTEVSPVAMAVCGDFGWAAAECVREIERQEKLKNLPEAAPPTRTRPSPRRIIMNTPLIIRGRALYARIRNKKTGAAGAKMRLISAYAKSLKQAKAAAAKHCPAPRRTTVVQKAQTARPHTAE